MAAPRTRVFLGAMLCAASRCAAFPTIGGPPICASLTAPYYLRADGKPAPSMGTSAAPLFSWALPATNVSAVRVQVFSVVGGAPGSTLWDSGPLPAQWSTPAPAGSLPPGAPFSWRVGAQSAAAAWEWSDNATLVTALAPGGWVAEPVWHPNGTTPFALLRGSLPLSRGAPRAAFAFVTAQPQRSPGDHENGKLLGAYKLFVEGALVGIGPGRPGTCGPVYPGPHPGEAPCAPEFYFDVLDVTAALGAAAGAGGSAATLALQCFNNPPDGGRYVDASRVILQVHAYFGADDAPVVVATRAAAGGGWLAFDAAAWINPTCCTESAWFRGLQENWDLRAEPLGWKTASFAPGGGWVPPAAAGPVPGALTAKPTQSLRVLEALPPAASWPHPSGAGVVYDVGREIQGGFTLLLPGAAPAGAAWVVQAGEELQADGSVMSAMRTGNNYSHTVTARTGGGEATLHEYMECVLAAGGGLRRAPPTAPNPPFPPSQHTKPTPQVPLLIGGAGGRGRRQRVRRKQVGGLQYAGVAVLRRRGRDPALSLCQLGRAKRRVRGQRVGQHLCSERQLRRALHPRHAHRAVRREARLYAGAL